MSSPESNDHKIVVNVRAQGNSFTGVQRYIQELCDRLNCVIDKVSPSRSQHGILGHLWEQAILPRHVGDRLLWSPANTGPLAVERQVLTVHDVAPLDHPEWFKPMFAHWYQHIIPALARRVRCLITVSEFSKTRLISLTGIDDSRVHVIPNGVNRRFYPRDLETVGQLRERLNIPKGRYLLSLSSIEPRKNLKRLLEAWSLCVPQLPSDVCLVIAGVEGKPDIFQEAPLGEIPLRVHWTGFVPDDELPILYSGAVAFIYPSVYEGFGLPLLEAMATGTATIAGNCTAIPEVTGDASVLVDPYSVTSISAAIEGVVRDDCLRQRLRRRGIERSRHFTWENAAALTEAIFLGALLGSKRA
jgi:glycosyltransferase involved in cell wall biosynthesis